MSKKKKKKAAGQEGPSQEMGKSGGEAVSVDKEAISASGWKTIGGGLGLLVLGFIALSLTDPEGRNWASTLSPFLILGAYTVIGFGIFLPEETPGKVPGTSPVSPAPSGVAGDPPKTSG